MILRQYERGIMNYFFINLRFRGPSILRIYLLMYRVTTKTLLDFK